MAKEIERKFLVESEAWREEAGRGCRIRQGYIPSPALQVRVRIAGEEAFLTLKHAASENAMVRDEFEYSIPRSDAEELLDRFSSGGLIEKTRYRIPHAGATWEVDEFHGPNAGLVVAEIELEREDQAFDRPSWVGREVTGEARYGNRPLVSRPFSTW